MILEACQLLYTAQHLNRGVAAGRTEAEVLKDVRSWKRDLVSATDGVASLLGLPWSADVAAGESGNDGTPAARAAAAASEGGHCGQLVRTTSIERNYAYKTAHAQHPSARWVRAALPNYLFMYVQSYEV
jgi:hypothetical protein